MAKSISSSLAELDFYHLVYYAHKKFYEGVSTIELLQQADSEQEREEISLVALLEVEGNLTLELKHQKQYVLRFQLSDFKRAMALSVQQSCYSNL